MCKLEEGPLVWTGWSARLLPGAVGTGCCPDFCLHLWLKLEVFSMWVMGHSSHAVPAMLVLIFVFSRLYSICIYCTCVSMCVAYVCHGATVHFSRSEDNLW